MRESSRFFLRYRRDIHIDVLQFPVVYGRKQYKSSRLFIGDLVFRITAYIVFFNLQVGFQLLLSGSMDTPYCVCRDSKRKHQRCSQHKGNHAFLFHVYNPFRGIRCILRGRTVCFQNKALVNIAESLR